MIAGKDRMRSTAKNFLVVDLFFFIPKGRGFTAHLVNPAQAAFIQF